MPETPYLARCAREIARDIILQYDSDFVDRRLDSSKQLLTGKPGNGDGFEATDMKVRRIPREGEDSPED